MYDSQLSHEFFLERAKRDIRECGDIDCLRSLCLCLLQQAEAQRDMLKQLLRP